MCARHFVDNRRLFDLIEWRPRRSAAAHDNIDCSRQKEGVTLADESLENELESAGRRLQTGDSFSLHADAQLDRARLRSDLDLVQGQIARLRLQRVFGGPAAQMGGAEAAVSFPQAEPVGAQSASEKAETLNLLA